MSDNASGNARVEERFRAGEKRFSRLERRIDASDEAVKEHLQQQDEKIDTLVAEMADLRADTKSIQANTQSMVDTWEGGARAVRALCRLADAWRFLVRHVAGPTIAGITIGVIVYRYIRHEPIPDWANAVVKLLLG
ncbi:hypothetical protein K6W26_23215 [Burkholderia sp. AU42008]|uniref:hypothetical protein n=1 Tax=unclassified Burkholderia TaxID=2613784 RepID=UPI000B7A39B5|nr:MULTISPECIES: hypothetical protein [unclassified Burkholderia]MBR8234589.1 hypothetical protein [Burkholderia sp. AU32357]MBY4875968.1 hypothetical protein [Burkholderia sp. AU42008]OXI44954.1 hypothetical protein CFB49_07810 [Burkholderia sp. AU17457]